MCQRGNCLFGNLLKVYKLLTFLKRQRELKQECQKSPAGTRQTEGKNWFGDIERKLAKFYLLFLFIIILYQRPSDTVD
jgi:hypothetical protein